MSEMLARQLQEYLNTVTPEIVEHKRQQYEAYMNRQYKGKPWRRLSNEEIKSLGDKTLEERLNEINKVAAPVIQNPNDWLVYGDENIYVGPDAREADYSQPFERGGHGSDLECETDEDWDKLSDKIAGERKRIFNYIRTPPRTERFVDIFKRKFPNRSEQEIREGFVLSENGVVSSDYTDMKQRQITRHTNSGAKRLAEAEVKRREEIAPENKQAFAYADSSTTMAIHKAVFNSSPVHRDIANDITSRWVTERRQREIEKRKFEVTEGDGFMPEEDLVNPEIYRLTGDAVELPVDALINKQREYLRITSIVRHIPPKEESNG